MFNLVSSDDYDVLVRRWVNQQANDCRDIDPRIVDTVKRFNTIDGVVSTWSCSGHTKAEYLLAHPNGNNYESRQDRYIMFAVTEQGTSIFRALESYMQQMDRDDWALTRPDLKTCLLNWCFGDGRSDNLTLNSLRLYPCWSISMYYHHLEDNPEMTKCIHAGLEENWSSMIDYIINFCNKEPV